MKSTLLAVVLNLTISSLAFARDTAISEQNTTVTKIAQCGDILLERVFTDQDFRINEGDFYGDYYFRGINSYNVTINGNSYAAALNEGKEQKTYSFNLDGFKVEIQESLQFEGRNLKKVFSINNVKCEN